jgi:RNA polymerase sigma-70 factor (ECF subfamily)
MVRGAGPRGLLGRSDAGRDAPPRDEEAFAWLVDRYDGTLRRLASSFVSSRSVADEVVQETWLAVIGGIDRFEGRSSLKTWIFRNLMNVARTRGARENRSLPFSSMAGDASDPSDAEPSFPRERFDRRPGPLHGHWREPPEPWEQQPAERLVTTEALDRVRQTIVRLPAQQQTVITLRDIEGLTSGGCATSST